MFRLRGGEWVLEQRFVTDRVVTGIPYATILIGDVTSRFALWRHQVNVRISITYEY